MSNSSTLLSNTPSTTDVDLNIAPKLKPRNSLAWCACGDVYHISGLRPDHHLTGTELAKNRLAYVGSTFCSQETDAYAGRAHISCVYSVRGICVI